MSARPRRRQGRRTPPSAQATASSAGEARGIPATYGLLLAGGAVVLLLFWLRWSARAPRDYDEYYHFALAREMWSGLRISSFRWTPFSLMFDHFADPSPLFHVLLMPLARLPLETAALLGALLGQLFAVGSLAWALAALRVPRPWWFLLALPALGTMALQRLEMCRPHVWLIGFSFLVLALLAQRRWKTLALASALLSLTHTGGWIAIAFAGLWTVLGLVVPRESDEPRLPWQPLAATAGGWLLGQLVHPAVPTNFRLFLLSNFVIPFQATHGGNAALRRELGKELFAPDRQLLGEQWPALLIVTLAVVALVRYPRLSTRDTLTVNLGALAFLLVGALLMRRFLELGEPLALLGLALVAREWREQDLPRPFVLWGGAVAGLLVALVSTLGANTRYDVGKWSPPREMARWLGAHGEPGDRVFTAQWADSGPLFYSAPQLESLVALDPTVFYAKDPALFATYSDIVRLRNPDPVRTIREQFGARWVTVWKAYPRFGMMLQRDRATIAYHDRDYVIFDLGTPPPSRGRLPISPVSSRRP